MSTTKQPISLESDADRWRYVCPRGHRSWEVTNFHFWCQQCARAHDDADPEFSELHDLKTGASIPRERLTIELRGSDA